MTVSWVCNVNPPRVICRNELYSDGLCLDSAFVPEDMYVIATKIDKRYSCVVNMRSARGIVTLIVCYRSHSDDDQAVPRVRVPSSASTGSPDITLHIDV